VVKPAGGAHVYVEGADREELRRSAREAFSTLFAHTLGPRKPRFIFCGSRLDTFNQFKAHLAQKRPERALLVVDAEDVLARPGRWNHLAHRKGDGWKQPVGTTENDVRLMVVVMESWCLATAFPKRDLEKIPKDEVFRSLKKMGWTKEGSNSFDLVRKADPSLLRKRSAEFVALCNRLAELSSA
jgi:hypothetical protein